MRDESFLLDMLRAAQDVLTELAGMSHDEFLGDRLVQTFVAHQIQTIGEAAGRVSLEFQRTHPAIEWADITGMRHKIVHGYRDIDLEIIWSTAAEDLPALVNALEPLVPPEKEA